MPPIRQQPKHDSCPKDGSWLRACRNKAREFVTVDRNSENPVRRDHQTAICRCCWSRSLSLSVLSCAAVELDSSARAGPPVLAVRQASPEGPACRPALQVARSFASPNLAPADSNQGCDAEPIRFTGSKGDQTRAVTVRRRSRRQRTMLSNACHRRKLENGFVCGRGACSIPSRLEAKGGYVTREASLLAIIAVRNCCAKSVKPPGACGISITLLPEETPTSLIVSKY